MGAGDVMAGSCALVCGIIAVGLVSAVPIAMICMGVIHMDACPMEQWVPVWMLGAGIAGLVTIVVSVGLHLGQSNDNKGCTFCCGALLVIAMLFSFGWNIAGSVWVFKKWSNWDNVKDTDKGCYNDLYLFAFAYLILFWITLPCTGGGAAKKRQQDSQA